jgi:hypothetical protein
MYAEDEVLMHKDYKLTLTINLCGIKEGMGVEEVGLVYRRCSF